MEHLFNVVSNAICKIAKPLEYIGFALALLDIYFPKFINYLENKLDFFREWLSYREEEDNYDIFSDIKYYIRNVFLLVIALLDVLILLIIFFIGDTLSELISKFIFFLQQQTFFGKAQYIFYVTIGGLSLLGGLIFRWRIILFNVVSFLDKITGGKVLAAIGLLIALVGLINNMIFSPCNCN